MKEKVETAVKFQSFVASFILLMAGILSPSTGGGWILETSSEKWESFSMSPASRVNDSIRLYGGFVKWQMQRPKNLPRARRPILAIYSNYLARTQYLLFPVVFPRLNPTRCNRGFGPMNWT